MTKTADLTPSVLAGAVLIGFGGAKWLTAAVAQRVQQETAPADATATSREPAATLKIVPHQAHRARRTPA